MQRKERLCRPMVAKMAGKRKFVNFSRRSDVSLKPIPVLYLGFQSSGPPVRFRQSLSVRNLKQLPVNNNRHPKPLTRQGSCQPAAALGQIEDGKAYQKLVAATVPVVRVRAAQGRLIRPPITMHCTQRTLLDASVCTRADCLPLPPFAAQHTPQRKN